VELIVRIFLIIASLILIASILLQSGKSAGMSGEIAGGAESLWGRNKGRSYEGKLEKGNFFCFWHHRFRGQFFDTLGIGSFAPTTAIFKFPSWLTTK